MFNRIDYEFYSKMSVKWIGKAQRSIKLVKSDEHLSDMEVVSRKRKLKVKRKCKKKEWKLCDMWY